MAPPVIQATGETATFVKASCGTIDSAGVLTCDFGQLRSGELDRLTVVWNVPAETRSAGCTDCLVANSTWLINENKSTNGNETFTQAETADLIGSSATEPVNNQLRAGGYEITGCTTGGSSLNTNQAVSKNNPVATSFCLPGFSTTTTDLGLATTITETAGERARVGGVRRSARSELPGRHRADFGPSDVDHVHVPGLGRCPAEELPDHEGLPRRPRAADVRPRASHRRDECVDSITSDKEDEDLDDRHHGRDERAVEMVR